MIVGMHLGPFPFGIFKWSVGQQTQGWPFNLFKQFLSGSSDPPHLLVVEHHQQFRDGIVLRFNREELLIAQPGQDPTFDNKNRSFHFCLVAWLTWACRQNGRVVMGCHGFKGGG